ncbi:MAG: bacillithiol system protein YtxJ [Saprospiraceae bacterium]|jgi:bacillithiol system protein YtxJ
MDFINLKQVAQLDQINEQSKNKAQVLFKHSTRCSVSTFAKRILTSEFSEEMAEKFDVHYLDLIAHRDVSGAIADKYNVVHESPQMLVIVNGTCVYNASHSDVSLEKATQVIA